MEDLSHQDGQEEEILVMPEHDENGVDLTIVRLTLAMTPTERLKSLENAMNAFATVVPTRT